MKFSWFIRNLSYFLIVLSVLLVAFASGQLTPIVLWLFFANFVVLLLLRWAAKCEWRLAQKVEKVEQRDTGRDFWVFWKK